MCAKEHSFFNIFLYSINLTNVINNLLRENQTTYLFYK